MRPFTLDPITLSAGKFRFLSLISETTPRSLTPLQQSITTSSIIKATASLINKHLAMMMNRVAESQSRLAFTSN